MNKVNTEVDMTFNVRKAEWLLLRIRKTLLVTETNRVEGDDVVHANEGGKGNIE